MLILENLTTTKKIKLIEPDFIFHLAAQSLVKKSYDDPVTTWQSNLISTLNLLESLRHTKNYSCNYYK